MTFAQEKAALFPDAEKNKNALAAGWTMSTRKPCRPSDGG
jgi:hypothetical protein